MAEILDIKTEEAAKKLSLFKKYIYEILILALFYLVYQVNSSLNIQKEKYDKFLETDRLEGFKVINNNTQALIKVEGFFSLQSK